MRKLFTQAIEHHRDGHLEAAEHLYRQILALDDRHADSLHLLGMITFKTNRRTEAIECIRAAIAVDGTQANYHSNLGNVLRAEGRHEGWPRRSTGARWS